MTPRGLVVRWWEWGLPSVCLSGWFGCSLSLSDLHAHHPRVELLIAQQPNLRHNTRSESKQSPICSVYLLGSQIAYVLPFSSDQLQSCGPLSVLPLLPQENFHGVSAVNAATRPVSQPDGQPVSQM